MTEIQTGADQNPEILIGTEANQDQANKYNAGTVGKQVTLGINAKVLKRRMKMIFNEQVMYKESTIRPVLGMVARKFTS